MKKVLGLVLVAVFCLVMVGETQAIRLPSYQPQVETVMIEVVLPESPPEFMLSWGIDKPAGVAIDSTGKVYVSDSLNHRIQKFDASGNFILEWGEYGTQASKFDTPKDIAIDASGNIFVSDWGNRKVKMFDLSGNLLEEFGSNQSIQAPGGVAVDSIGSITHLYLADRGALKFRKYSITDVDYGTYVGKKVILINSWGGGGSGDGMFAFAPDSGPFSVAINLSGSSGHIYASDIGNNRMQRFGSAGVFKGEWGRSGSGNGQFNKPGDIAIDASGNVYVVDMGNNRIQKFNFKGDLLTVWGKYGSGNGEFNEPSSIAIDASGKIYVADMNNNRIQKFRPKQKIRRRRSP